MIKEFVEKFQGNKNVLEEKFKFSHPCDYKEIVKWVVEILGSNSDRKVPDPEKIHEINDGSWQGTLVYIVGEKGDLPSDYWYAKVNYGSCSVCDTLEGIKMMSHKDRSPTQEQIEDYMNLALHIVQNFKKMGNESV